MLPNRVLRQLALDFSVHAVDFNPLQQSEKESAMNKSSPVSLAPLAALLFAGSALAQAISPSGADANRADRHCISTTLSADPSAPCSGDVLNDRPGETPAAARYAPPNSTAGSVTPNTAIQPGSTGTTVTGTVNAGAGSTPTGTSMGTGTSGTSSTAGATGTGAASATGAAGAPARR